MRKLRGKLWIVWCFLSSSITLLVAYPSYLLILIGNKQDKLITAARLSRFWAKVLSVLWLIRVTEVGADDRKALEVGGEPTIIVSNHSSYLDIPVCSLVTKEPFAFVAKKELVKAPLLGDIIRRIYIIVQRDDPRAAALAFTNMKKRLKHGQSVWIYPEGSRNQTELALLPLQPGAATLAIKTGTAIKVVAFLNTKKLLDSKNKVMYPGTVYYSWGKSINPLEYENAAELNQAMKLELVYLLKHLDDSVKD